MVAVAIHARGHVLIVFLQQGLAVNALGIYCVNFAVALLAGLGDFNFTGVENVRLVTAVTVRADSRADFTAGLFGEVVPLAILGICAFMTGAAGAVGIDDEFPRAVVTQIMRKSLDVGMALHAGDALFGVDVFKQLFFGNR